MKKLLIVSTTLFTPAITFAAADFNGANFNGIEALMEEAKYLVGLALPIVSGLALLGFFWGLAMFIFKSGDEAEVDKGKNIMKWGLIALFVMVAVWGIVRFMADTLGVGTAGNPTTPTINDLGA